MKSQKTILQQLQALSMGPSWTEKTYDTGSDTNKFVKTEKVFSQSKDPQSHQKVIARCKEQVDVSFRPDFFAMNALIQTLKKSCITYQFSSVVRLFLEKSNRFEVVITANKGHYVFCVGASKLPFLTLESAQDYLVEKYWDDIFESQVEYLDPPKGVFTSVNFCGMTNVLLGPPNYHLYNDILQEYYEANLKGRCSYEEFLGSIRNVRDEAVVNQWIEQMMCNYCYYLKSDPSVRFENRNLAKSYLLQHLPETESIVKLSQLVFPYSQVQCIVDKDLCLLLEHEGKIEQHNPARLSNFCRARFHHMGLHIYRRGRGLKTIVYVCSIKRNVRDEFTHFAPDLIPIINCIDAHPCMSLECLMKIYFQDYQKLLGDEKKDQQQIERFKQNLILLVRQGYVTQYEDGTLYISPQQTLDSKKNRKKVPVEEET